MSENSDESTNLFELREFVEETYPETDPVWKAFGRIEVKTGINIESVDKDTDLDEVIENTEAQINDLSFGDLVEAAEEVTGGEFSLDEEVSSL